MTAPLRSADPVWLRRVGLGLRLHAWVTPCVLVVFCAMIGLRIAIAEFDRRTAAAGAAADATGKGQPADPEAPVKSGQLKVVTYGDGPPKAVTIDSRSVDVEAMRRSNDELERTLRFGGFVLAATGLTAMLAFGLFGLWYVSVFLLAWGEPQEGFMRRRSRVIVRIAPLVAVVAAAAAAMQDEDEIPGSLAAIVAFGSGSMLARALEQILVGLAARLPNPDLAARLKRNLERLGHADLAAMGLIFLGGLTGHAGVRSVLLGLMLAVLAVMVALVVEYQLLIRRESRELSAVVARRS